MILSSSGLDQRTLQFFAVTFRNQDVLIFIIISDYLLKAPALYVTS